MFFFVRAVSRAFTPCTALYYGSASARYILTIAQQGKQTEACLSPGPYVITLWIYYLLVGDKINRTHPRFGDKPHEKIVGELAHLWKGWLKYTVQKFMLRLLLFVLSTNPYSLCNKLELQHLQTLVYKQTKYNIMPATSLLYMMHFYVFCYSK